MIVFFRVRFSSTGTGSIGGAAFALQETRKLALILVERKEHTGTADVLQLYSPSSLVPVPVPVDLPRQRGVGESIQ